SQLCIGTGQGFGLWALSAVCARALWGAWVRLHPQLSNYPCRQGGTFVGASQSQDLGEPDERPSKNTSGTDPEYPCGNGEDDGFGPDGRCPGDQDNWLRWGRLYAGLGGGSGSGPGKGGLYDGRGQSGLWGAY